MNKYAIALISFFDNENKIFIVEANNEIESMKKALFLFNGINDESFAGWTTTVGETIEEVKSYCFNGDIGISSPVLVS